MLPLVAGAIGSWFARRKDKVEPPVGGDVLHPSVFAPSVVEDDAVVLARACEVIRRATDAHEAAVWVTDAGHKRARRIGRSALPGYPPSPDRVDLAGHPFGWAIVEQAHIVLERGKKPLPSDWAAEMLLIPLAAPAGVLALAYGQHVPPGTEPAAIEAGAHVLELLSLLRERRHARRVEVRMEAVLDAVRDLPGELETDRFAARLADAVIRSTDAMGVAVVAWQADFGTGEVLACRGEPDAAVAPGVRIAEGESRLALAAKHGVNLHYADLQRERDRLPLCAATEHWTVPPRSATIQPLVAAGKVVGAVAAWHAQPNHFDDREQEFLRLLGMIAPHALQNARRYEALDRRASTDALTGLPNRHTFDARLAAIATYYDRYARPFGLLVIDVDFFKKFNDTWGHEAGDRVLQHVAQLIRSTVREVDLPARLGGEEFVVLMPETRVKEAVEVAERVRTAIEEHPVIWQGRPLPVTVSVGAAACPDCGDDPERILAAADAALYEAKAAGRNRVIAARAAATARQ